MDWNIIFAFLGFTAVVVPIIMYKLQSNKKSLSYEIISKNSLLTSKENVEGKIKILFNENEVHNVSFIEIRVTNTGRIGIPAKDYESSLSFIFSDKTKILSSEIIESIPDNLVTDLRIDQNKIILRPFLMNSKDSITIKIIIANSTNDDIIVKGRIKDVKIIKKLKSNTLRLFPIYMFLTVVISYSILFSTLFVIDIINRDQLIQSILLILIFFLVVLVPLITFLIRKEKI